MLKIADFAYGIAQTGLGQFALAMLLSAAFQGRGDASLRLSRMTGLIHIMVLTMVYPAAVVLTAMLFARSGGLIALPSHSGWIVLGFLIYLLTFDLLVYLLHRAQHAIPFLWAMHSLHHAETRVTAMTAYVNYWGEALIENAFVYPIVFVLFKVPPVFVFAGIWVKFVFSLFVHAEMKLYLGPIGCIIVGPQYHRLHHSSDPKHFGANFTGMFPIWDFLFGTLVIPDRGQFPVTGLEHPEAPPRSFETLWWPLRNLLGPESR